MTAGGNDAAFPDYCTHKYALLKLKLHKWLTGNIRLLPDDKFQCLHLSVQEPGKSLNIAAVGILHGTHILKYHLGYGRLRTHYSSDRKI